MFNKKRINEIETKFLCRMDFIVSDIRKLHDKIDKLENELIVHSHNIKKLQTKLEEKEENK